MCRPPPHTGCPPRQVPFYNEIKLAFYVYLGQFNGATVVYEKFGKNAIKSVEGQVKQLSEKPEVKQLVQATQEARGFLRLLGRGADNTHNFCSVSRGSTEKKWAKNRSQMVGW